MLYILLILLAISIIAFTLSLIMLGRITKRLQKIDKIIEAITNTVFGGNK